jgi:hypothetical protein
MVMSLGVCVKNIFQDENNIIERICHIVITWLQTDKQIT